MEPDSRKLFSITTQQRDKFKVAEEDDDNDDDRASLTHKEDDDEKQQFLRMENSGHQQDNEIDHSQKHKNKGSRLSERYTNNTVVQSQTLLRYGWGCFKPSFIQFMNRPSFFMASLCIVVFGQGLASTGINNSMITSVEKRYGFKTTEIGLFSTFFHASAGLFVTVVAYFGHRHRPFTLGLACLSIAMGLFVITIPHYMAPKYVTGVALITDTCRQPVKGNLTSASSKGACVQTDSIDKSRYFGVFALGYMLMGVGVTPLYSLGYAHINEIVGRSKASIYLAIVGMIATVGPAVGFMIGNPIVNVFVDLKQVSNLVCAFVCI